MTPRHYTIHELLHFIDKPDEVGDGEALLSHVETCIACRQLMAEARRIWDALRDPEAWIDAKSIAEAQAVASPPPPHFLEDFRRLRTQMETENAEAPAGVDALLDGGPAEWLPRLDDGPLFLTAGVVRLLCEKFREEVYRNPGRALEIASLAGAIADRLDAVTYRKAQRLDLQALARKHEANALRLLGRLREALVVLDDAEGILKDLTVPEPSVAGLRHVRASVLCGLERLGEAVTCAHHAADVYDAFGEKTKAANAALLEGVIRFQLGHVRQAREIFLRLVPVFREAEELPSLAGVYSNLGSCEGDLGDSGAAAQHYDQALQLFKRLGMAAEETRMRWSLGRMMVSAGQVDRGLPLLGQAGSEFRTFGMLLDAAMVDLLRAEVLLGMSESEAAKVLLDALPAHFRSAGLEGNALTAVAYLEEANRSGRLSMAALSHVRRYLEAAPKAPDRRFLPPTA